MYIKNLSTNFRLLTQIKISLDSVGMKENKNKTVYLGI